MLYGDTNEMYERALRSHERHGNIWGYPMHTLRQGISVGPGAFPSLYHMSARSDHSFEDCPRRHFFKVGIEPCHVKLQYIKALCHQQLA